MHPPRVAGRPGQIPARRPRSHLPQPGLPAFHHSVAPKGNDPAVQPERWARASLIQFCIGRDGNLTSPLEAAEKPSLGCHREGGLRMVHRPVGRGPRRRVPRAHRDRQGALGRCR